MRRFINGGARHQMMSINDHFVEGVKHALADYIGENEQATPSALSSTVRC